MLYAVCIIIVFELVYKLVVISCLTLTKIYEKFSKSKRYTFHTVCNRIHLS